MNDRYFMHKALKLAEKGRGRTAPNPMVGAVVVRDGKVVGKGYHDGSGTPHAEVHALDDAGDQARGATLYVNLEPCCHQGRTPPCTDRIIQSGIQRVVTAMEDPNPAVSGGGIEILSQAGIDTVKGIMKDEAEVLNEAFVKYIEEARPFVLSKTAMTLDGKVATSNGDSRWITSELARFNAHHLRDYAEAIMVGIGTVLSDDPLLTTRLEKGRGRHPLRVVPDSRLRIPFSARIIDREQPGRTLVATTGAANEDKQRRLEQQGVEVLVCPEDDAGRVDIEYLLKQLAQREIMSLLLEGGPHLNSSFLERQLIDKFYFFLAPRLIGGQEALSPFAGRGAQEMKDALDVNIGRMESLGEGELLLEAYPDYDRGGEEPCSPES